MTICKPISDRKSLKGVVLIMVVTVMCVLIVMLLATLTVVSTAKNRTYEKYEENQAYYAARSALDIFRENLMNDDDYYAYSDAGMTSVKMYNYADYSGATPDYTKSIQMTQGRALELELYKIVAKNDAGYASNMVVGDDIFGGSTGNPDNKNYSIEPVSRASTYSEDDLKDFYEVTLPDVSNGSNSYGRFCDDGKARITVEILNRRYDSGGLLDEFTDAQLEAAAASGTIVNGDGTTIDIKKAIKEGSRSKDVMLVRITATTTFLDTEGTAVLEYNTYDNKKPTTNNALTTTGGFSGGAGAQLSPAGGASTLDTGTSIIADGNTASGLVFSEGSIEFTSSAKARFDGDDGIYAMGDLFMKNNADVKSNGDKTVLYAGGSITLKGTVGDSAHPITAVCGKMQSFDGNYTFNGDIITNCYSALSPGGAFGADNNITVNGTIYAKQYSGPVFVQDSTIYIPVGSKQLVLSSDFTIDATNGTQDAVNEALLNSYPIMPCPCKESYDSGSCSGSVTVLTSAFDVSTYAIEVDNTKTYRTIAVPAAISKIFVPTAQAMFADHFMDGAFDANGELNLAAGETAPYADTNINKWVNSAYSALTKINPTLFPASETTMDVITNSSSGGGTIAASCRLTSGGTTTFDTSTGDLFIQLVPGTTYGGTWTVTGSNAVNFIMPEGSSNIFTFENIKIESEAIKSNTGSIVNGTTKAPKINYYCGTGAQVQTRNNTFFAGYFYMPTASFYLNNGYGQTVSYKSSSSATPVNVENSAVVGSIIVGNFTCANKPGLIYLDSSSGASDPGKTELDWTAYQFTRN